jgi:hypothetical protein
METSIQTVSFTMIAGAALHRGFYIIPLQPASKVPMPGWGATRGVRVLPDVPQDCNVGVCAAPDLCILDVDSVNGLAMKADPTPYLQTYAVESSPGKRHFYLRPVGPVENLDLGPLGSLRASNQYVVGAGSIHPKTGLPYKVVNAADVLELHPGYYNELRKVAGNVKREQRRVFAQFEKGQRQFGAGERHYFLREWAARNYFGDVDDLFERLWEINLKHCDPPKSEHQVQSLARWFEGRESAPRLIRLKWRTQ